MTRLKALVREPALLIDLAETLVVLLVAYGLANWDKEQQGYLVAAVIALAGVGKAFSTRPFPVTALTDATRAVLVVAASVFGVGLSADQIALTATLVGTAFTIVARAQITPVKDPIVEPGGAGAGPVAEGGYSDLVVIAGVVLLILGLLGLVLIALHNPLLPLVWCLLIALIGVVLVFAGRRSSRF